MDTAGMVVVMNLFADAILFAGMVTKYRNARGPKPGSPMVPSFTVCFLFIYLL